MSPTNKRCCVVGPPSPACANSRPGSGGPGASAAVGSGGTAGAARIEADVGLVVGREEVGEESVFARRRTGKARSVSLLWYFVRRSVYGVLAAAVVMANASYAENAERMSYFQQRSHEQHCSDAQQASYANKPILLRGYASGQCGCRGVGSNAYLLHAEVEVEAWCSVCAGDPITGVGL